ncbi:zinc finger protein ubi-d4 [Nesidiocoris tenuis]|uniref:Zinc finger protein ubi-d4 n=1 Tax=Nesidiocoris tenuis TaxID=355587 RepID=A0ABN7A8W5_9HEMI|nr:zinc finger protein ubi-d4 [Nesidiocoris tenuis]
MASCDIQISNPAVLSRIESFMADTAYREALENSSNFNTRLCIERRLRMPFLDSQTGIAQNHSKLFMSPRERIPGLLCGQVYTYPSQRWRKKRRQYLMQPQVGIRRCELQSESNDLHTISTVENPAAAASEDSKDSASIKDDTSTKASQDAWYYDELELQAMEGFEDVDPDSDYDYEETYSKRRKKRGGGKQPGGGRGGLTPSETPHPKKGAKGTGQGRGRKKGMNYAELTDSEKPFVCDICGARYKTRPGLTYHYTHSHKDGGSGGGGRGGGGGSGGLPPPSSTTPPSSSSCSSSSGGGSIMMSTMVGGSVDDELASTAAGPPHELQPPPPMQTTGQALPPSQPPGGGQDGGLHPPPPQPQSWPPFPGQQDSYLSYLNATPGPAAGRRGGRHGGHGGPHGHGGHPNSGMPDDIRGGQPGPSPHSKDNKDRMPGPSPEQVLVMEQNEKERAVPSPYCDFCLGDAVSNKKSGQPEELVSCSDCGRSGHPSCLLFTDNMIVSVRKYRWQCIECKCCSLCGTSDNDDQLLFCDDCDRGYHMYCLIPPLDTPPEGSWSCRTCIRDFHGGVIPNK